MSSLIRSLFPVTRPGASWEGTRPAAVVADEVTTFTMPRTDPEPDWLDEALGHADTPPDTVIDLDRRVTYAETCTSRRARRLAARAVKASVRDVRDGGPAGVYAAYVRLARAAERTVTIDADEAAKAAV